MAAAEQARLAGFATTIQTAARGRLGKQRVVQVRMLGRRARVVEGLKGGAWCDTVLLPHWTTARLFFICRRRVLALLSASPPARPPASPPASAHQRGIDIRMTERLQRAYRQRGAHKETSVLRLRIALTADAAAADSAAGASLRFRIENLSKVGEGL